MNFQTDGKVAFDGEDIVEVDNVVVPTGDDEPVVSCKLDTSDFRGVSIFILFYQHEWFECSPVGRSLIHAKSIILGNGKQPSIIAELSTVYVSFEIELSHDEVAFQIEDNSIACQINGNQQHSIWAAFDDANLVMGLEREDRGMIAREVDEFNMVEEGRIE